MGVPQNGGFTRENTIKMDDDWGTPILGNFHVFPVRLGAKDQEFPKHVTSTCLLILVM